MAPQGTVEFALFCSDPDAPLPGGFHHWTLYGIPAGTTRLDDTADAQYRPGFDGWGELGYGGPQPPSGHGRHHYFFRLYALRRHVEGSPDYVAFLREYADAVIDQARLVGTYEQ